MDELCTFQSAASDYSMQFVPENMIPAPPDYHAFPSPGASFPVLGSDQFFSGSSVSDATSMVAEMQRGGGGGSEEFSSSTRAKIASHPLYPKLIKAYIDCQKVGAPPEMVYLLDEVRRESDLSKRSPVVPSCLEEDPELDQFMETYCDILVKYKSDLSRPLNEATTFLNDVEAQLNILCNSSSRTHVSDEAVGSSEEEGSGGGVEVKDCVRANEDRELKDKLLRKYSGYISTLKQEFSKKKKNGKLPKEATQILLNWWNIHYKWPYPTEADKIALADATGLDQKQISNWFINQRKRHWKPSENMQFTVADSTCGPFFMND
ncbi:hypothetical protein P3X46_030966 [Hevea brasiliensis]|uniref:Homeobox protein knotted-1-like 6 n=1 Tax=Hevea brasiliensis TaxID=3981 RepID=A0ABQ9KIT0_HEVBR|nr:homeobox protein knotted-1-like 6 [Hevea brasiliensis]KAJ9140303.1 hypothetical protein P3X46_030966 [Hevea brasiliensis]